MKRLSLSRRRGAHAFAAAFALACSLAATARAQSPAGYPGPQPWVDPRQAPPAYAPAPPPSYGAPPPAYAPVAPPPAATPPARERRPGELYLVLGPGAAVCDGKKPVDDCPVDGGFAVGIGGDWRFAPHFSLGGDLAFWALHVRSSWQGKLEDPATKVSFSSAILAPHLRWYWFGDGPVDAYLQGGLGVGSVTGHAENDGGSYDVKVTGTVVPVAIGAEWLLGEHVRLGGQGLAYVQISKEKCESSSSAAETCSGATSEQNALVWRLAASASYLFGGP